MDGRIFRLHRRPGQGRSSRITAPQRDGSSQARSRLCTHRRHRDQGVHTSAESVACGSRSSGSSARTRAATRWAAEFMSGAERSDESRGRGRRGGRRKVRAREDGGGGPLSTGDRCIVHVAAHVLALACPAAPDTGTSTFPTTFKLRSGATDVLDPDPDDGSCVVIGGQLSRARASSQVPSCGYIWVHRIP